MWKERQEYIAKVSQLLRKPVENRIFELLVRPKPESVTRGFKYLGRNYYAPGLGNAAKVGAILEEMTKHQQENNNRPGMRLSRELLGANGSVFALADTFEGFEDFLATRETRVERVAQLNTELEPLLLRPSASELRRVILRFGN